MQVQKSKPDEAMTAAEPVSQPEATAAADNPVQSSSSMADGAGAGRPDLQDASVTDGSASAVQPPDEAAAAAAEITRKAFQVTPFCRLSFLHIRAHLQHPDTPHVTDSLEECNMPVSSCCRHDHVLREVSAPRFRGATRYMCLDNAIPHAGLCMLTSLKSIPAAFCRQQWKAKSSRRLVSRTLRVQLIVQLLRKLLLQLQRQFHLWIQLSLAQPQLEASASIGPALR